MIFCVVFKEVEVKKENKTASPGKKRGPDKNLLPNPKIKILEKDPLFETKYVYIFELFVVSILTIQIHVYLVNLNFLGMNRC